MGLLGLTTSQPKRDSYRIGGMPLKSAGRRGTFGGKRTASGRLGVPAKAYSSIFVDMGDGGAEFGTWIDTLDNGTARANGKNAGDRVDNPAYVIEWILREALGARDGQIDYASFDVAGNTTTGLLRTPVAWEFTGAIDQGEDARAVLERLCNQSKSQLYKDENDKFSIWVYDDNPTVTYTAYDFGKLHLSNLQIYRTPLDDVAQTVRINYKLDRGSGEYQAQTFIEVNKKYSGSLTNEMPDASQVTLDVDDGTDFSENDYIMIEGSNEVMQVDAINVNELTIDRAEANSTATTHRDNRPIFILNVNSDDGTGTQDQNAATPNNRELLGIESLWRYGQRQEFIMDADFVTHDLTAQTLREHWHDYLKSPKWIVEFDTDLAVYDLKPNDIIEFNSTDMNDLLKIGGSEWTGIHFVVLGVQRKGQMDFHAIAEYVPAIINTFFS